MDLVPQSLWAIYGYCPMTSSEQPNCEQNAKCYCLCDVRQKRQEQVYDRTHFVSPPGGKASATIGPSCAICAKPGNRKKWATKSAAYVATCSAARHLTCFV